MLQLLNIHFLFSFNSDNNQEFNDEDITESDMKMIDQNVALAAAIDFELTDEDFRNIDVDVAITEAAEFEVTKGECGDQSITEEEEIADMAMADLEDEQNIDPFVYMEDGGVGWAEINESYNTFIQEQQQIVDQRRQAARDEWYQSWSANNS